MRYLFSIFVLLNLTGCYTIHFVKDSNQTPWNYNYTSWHHIGLLGLVEFSDPVNLVSTCGGPNKWESVKVQTGFLQGLVRNISIPTGSRTIPTGSGSVEVPATINIGSLYSPEEVSISCK